MKLRGTRRVYDLKDVWHLQLHLLSIAPGNDPLSIAYYVMDSPLKDWSTLDSLAIDSGLAALADLNLLLDRDNKAVICTYCKYALQSSGQTVSKHL